MSTQEQPKDFFSTWAEFQKNFYTQWAEAYGKFYQPWLDSLKTWQGMKVPLPGADLFSKWSEMIRESIGKATDQAGEGLGVTVMSRILRASNVFVILNEFWMEILKDLPALYQAKGDAAKSREIFEGWVQRYKKVFEQMLGTPVSTAAEDLMTTWLNILQMNQATWGLMWNPWAQVMPKWREHVEKFMKGDWSALIESRSLWREVYDETLGRVFRMPAFGLTKDQVERLKKTYDALVQYWSSVPAFYQFFYKTGMEALREVYQKVQDLKSDEMKPEILREIYQIWWTTNEKAFFHLFKSPEFGQAMGEVLNYGLRLKKRLDDLTAEWCKAVSIPSNREFDEMAMAVQELRRKVRQQQRAIEELQRELGQTT